MPDPAKPILETKYFCSGNASRSVDSKVDIPEEWQMRTCLQNNSHNKHFILSDKRSVEQLIYAESNISSKKSLRKKSKSLETGVVDGGSRRPFLATDSDSRCRLPPRVDCLPVPVLLIPRKTVWREAGRIRSCTRPLIPGLLHVVPALPPPQWGSSTAASST